MPTHVVAMDPDDLKVALSNDLAVAGGTGAAHLAYAGNELTAELAAAIEAALGNTSCD